MLDVVNDGFNECVDRLLFESAANSRGHRLAQTFDFIAHRFADGFGIRFLDGRQLGHQRFEFTIEFAQAFADRVRILLGDLFLKNK